MAESNEFVSTGANSDMVELGAGFEPDRREVMNAAFWGLLILLLVLILSEEDQSSRGDWGLGT